MNTLTGLSSVAELMTTIDKLKATDKDFRTKLNDARKQFDILTAGISAPTTGEKGDGESGETTTPAPIVPTDKITAAKQRLKAEYESKLAALESILKQADGITSQISNLNTLTGKAFMDSLSSLATQYKKLDSKIKANVTNGDLLTSLQKDYNSTLKVFNLIEQLPKHTDKNLELLPITYTSMLLIRSKLFSTSSNRGINCTSSKSR